jgi:hypothetical protein
MITDEMISKCMADFDFNKVADLYQRMNWKWWDKGIPTKTDLIDSVYDKLKRLQKDYPKTTSIGSGGLYVKAHEEEGLYTILRLEFIAVSSTVHEE